MGERSRWNGSTLKAVGDDSGRVTCNGVLDLLDQFITCVNEGRTPPRATLKFLAWRFDQTLRGEGTLDESFGLRKDRAGRHKKYRGRLPTKDNHVAVRRACRDMKLARLVDELQCDGTKLTEAYRRVAAAESEASGEAISASTVQRAYKCHKVTWQRQKLLSPVQEALNRHDLVALMSTFEEPMDACEARYIELKQQQHAVALRAARECGEIYGSAVGDVDETLMTELLWGDDQMFGLRQILEMYFCESVISEEEAKREWRHGLRTGMQENTASRSQGLRRE